MASPPTRTPTSNSEQFILFVGAFFGVVAIGITVLGVSLPSALKFVLVVILGMLTVICVGLATLAAQQGRARE